MEINGPLRSKSSLQLFEGTIRGHNFSCNTDNYFQRGQTRYLRTLFKGTIFPARFQREDSPNCVRSSTVMSDFPPPSSHHCLFSRIRYPPFTLTNMGRLQWLMTPSTKSRFPWKLLFLFLLVAVVAVLAQMYDLPSWVYKYYYEGRYRQ